MNFLKRLFKRASPAPTPTAMVPCPRCLGKGRVDAEDIKRLRQELRWIPGRCAYCNGVGRVAEDLIGRVAVNEPYLTTNLPTAERLRLFNRDAGALQRSKQSSVNWDGVILQIRQLHFMDNRSAEEIAELFMQQNYDGPPGRHYDEERGKLVDYIKKVIYQQD